MKQLFTFLLVLLPLINFGQILKNNTPNLNTNGVVYDVAYDSYYNAYIIVGDFTTVNNIPRKNLAFIDADDFTLRTDVNLISNINGPIRSVQVDSFPIPHAFLAINIGMRHLIYLGGEFGTVNSQTKVNACRFTASHLYSQQPGTFSSYNLSAWNSSQYYQYMSGPGPEEGVFDQIIIGDTLIMVGLFAMDSYNNPGSDLILCAAAFDAKSDAVINVPMFEEFTFTEYPYNAPNYNLFFNGIGYRKNKFYLYGLNNGNGILWETDPHGNNIEAFDVCGNEDSYFDLEIINTNNEDLFVGLERYAGGAGIQINDSTGFMINCPFLNAEPVIFTGLLNAFIEQHNSKLFGAENNILKTYLINGRTPSNSVLSYSQSTNGVFHNGDATDGWRHKKIKKIENFLFLSGNNLTNINGNQRTGLAIFCLEPNDPKPFTDFDTTICFGNVVTYTIPKSNNAKGYRWTYTGSGAKYRLAGSQLPFTTSLTDSHILSDTAFSIEIQFESNTTAGILSVTPFNLCNTANDYLYSNSQSLNLTLAPLPNISMQDTMAFTCYSDTLVLTINSSTPNLTYEWEYQNSVIGTADSIILNTTSNPFNNSYYFGKVTEPINGCVNMDSVFVYFDTIAAPIPLNSYIQNPPVFNCIANSVDIDLNIPNATISWAVHPDSTQMASPLTLYSLDTTNLYSFVTYANNGCTAQQQFEVIADDTLLTGSVNGISVNGMPTIFETLSCGQPSISLNASVVSGNGTSEWIINGTSIGSTLNLTSVDTAGMHPTFHTKVYDFKTTNLNNGCSTTYSITIEFDFEKPFVSNLEDQSLNCSQSSIDILHPLNGGGSITEGWLDSFNNPTTNQSITINTIGTFYYQVTDNSNGCSNIDTVVVNQSNELFLNLVSDTLICPNQQVSIEVSNINNSEPTTYQWSNGSNGAIVSATGGIDNQLSVVAENQSGCIGYDTVQILINTPVTANFITSATCVEAAIQVSNISGGAGNYEFSIDNGASWQTTTFFDNLNFGNYTIAVRDELGCVYEFNEEIDGTASDPDLNFLVSTYNLNGDTLAIVNISNYTGFDSLIWTLPAGADVYSIDDSMVIVSVALGGWYDVVLTGFIDTCSYSFTKPVYFGDKKPDYNQDYSAKGIQTLILYPNPTTGLFTLEFTLGVSQNYSIVVTNLSGQPINSMSTSGIGTQFNQSFEFPLGTVPGNYRIHIITDFDAKQESIILNN